MITDKEILEVARKYWSFDHLSFDEVAFARAMIALGMEEAAEICDGMKNSYIVLVDQQYGFNAAKNDCAKKIRERIGK